MQRLRELYFVKQMLDCLEPGAMGITIVPHVLGVITWPNGADLDPAWMYEQVRENKTWSVPLLIRDFSYFSFHAIMIP